MEVGVKQLDFFKPRTAKFSVRCKPSGNIIFVRAASFAGARRAAAGCPVVDKRDRSFTPKFYIWERRIGESKMEGLPPEEFEWPKF